MTRKRTLLASLLVLFLTPSSAFPDATLQDLIGTWGFSQMGHRNVGTWYIVSGMMTFQSGDTGTFTYQWNINGTVSPVTTSPFTYTAEYFSGRVTQIRVTFNFTSIPPMTGYYYLSPDTNTMLVIGTEDTSQQFFGFGVRLNPDKTYAQGDFSGEYFSAGYQFVEMGPADEYNAWSTWGISNGINRVAFERTWNENGTVNSDDLLANYTVHPSGSISMSPGTARGYLSGDGKSLFFATTNEPNDFFLMPAIKKGNRGLSNADLAGFWVLNGFGDQGGTSFYSEYGVLGCNFQGNCAIDLIRNIDGTPATERQDVSISISADGTFHTSAASPAYAGAIGNDGKTMLINTSFNPLDLNKREILIGVKVRWIYFLPLLLR